MDASSELIKRSDLELALYYGAPTKFCVEDVPSDALTQLLGTYRNHLDKQIENFHFVKQLSSELLDVFLDVMTLAYLLNNHEKLEVKMNAYSFQDSAIGISYRLVRIRPLAAQRSTNEVENMLHLALTAFITPLFLTSTSVPLLPGLLREAAQYYLPQDSESRKILLWVLFIGSSSSMSTKTDDNWIVPILVETCLDLGLRTWTDIHGVLSQFPWINRAHGNAGQQLWKKIEKYSKPQYQNSTRQGSE
jgi:hypothetical protein